MKRIDLTGKVYGRLTVLRCTEKKNNHGQLFWRCKCLCGKEKNILGFNLRSGHSASCGCRKAEAGRRNFAAQKVGILNGRARKAKQASGDKYVPSSSTWYRRCAGRFYEAKKSGIVVGFDTVQEFAYYCRSIAPTHCPVFGYKLQPDPRKATCFSIDRIDSTKGYSPGNIQIISGKANMMKQDLGPDDLLKFARWVMKAYR